MTKENRKIIHIVGDSEFGGGSAIILQLAKHANANGYDASILTTSKKFQDIAHSNNIKTIDIDCIWRPIKPFKDTIGLWRLYKYLRYNKYNIVHTHTSKAGFIGRAAAKMAKVPFIVHTVHGFAFHEQSTKSKIAFYSTLERIAAHWCHKIITVSEYHRNWALNLKIGNESKIIAIPNGISENKVYVENNKKIRKELNISPNSMVLVSAGRIAHQKGLEYLVPAVSQLIKMGHNNLKVILAGDGPMRESLEDLIKFHKLEENFHLLGFRQDIADILAAGNIAVMPTEREGLSIALLEAMAAAKPIITTTIGSNIEVTMNGKYASLIEPCNIEALSKEIDKLINNPLEAKNMGIEARKHFLEMYTEEKMLTHYLDIYNSQINYKLI